MGCFASFPLQTNISFVPPRQFRNLQFVDNESFYYNVQKPYWIKLQQHRLALLESRNKFKDLDYDKVRETWETLTREQLKMLIIIYQTIDLNQDGLVDFNEMCIILDEIGDDSSEEERRTYFNQIDLDNSEGVDFEEFLQLITCAVGKDGRKSSSIGLEKLLNGQQYAQWLSKVQSLSIKEQLRHGLF